MNDKNGRPIEFMNVVTRFMTPFAIVLVLLGDLFAGPSPRVFSLSIGIVLITALGNGCMPFLLKRYPQKYLFIRKVRVTLNYAFNISLIYLMIPFWTPIWMLLLLTIVAVGVYENRRTTAIHAMLFTVLLFVVAFERGRLYGSFPYELAAYVIAIWFTGLFVNRLAESIPQR